jgi:hypothetical protein
MRAPNVTDSQHLFDRGGGELETNTGQGERQVTKERREPAIHTSSASLRRSSRLRSCGSSNRLRKRIDFGVTSTNSSSWM